MGCICKKPFQENNLEFEQNSNNFNNNENDENRNDDNTQNKYFSPVLNNNENENLQNTNINSNNNIEFNSNDNLKSVLKSNNNNNNNNLLNANLNNFQNKLNELKKSSILDKKSSNEKICENYCKKIIEFINLIRTFPHEYADYISYCMKNILIENEKKVNKETKEEITIKKIIYKKNVKVALNKGEEAFKDAFNTLINIEPIEPLIEKEELKIDLPQNINEVRDSNYMRNNVLKKNNEGVKIEVFFKDLIKDPEVSSLLMVVDDNKKNYGKKREAILNKNFKYIGVNCTIIEKVFVAFFTFSK
jgi:hypothetical protein